MLGGPPRRGLPLLRCSCCSCCSCICETARTGDVWIGAGRVGVGVGVCRAPDKPVGFATARRVAAATRAILTPPPPPPPPAHAPALPCASARKHAPRGAGRSSGVARGEGRRQARRARAWAHRQPARCALAVERVRQSPWPRRGRNRAWRPRGQVVAPKVSRGRPRPRPRHRRLAFGKGGARNPALCAAALGDPP